MPKKQNGTDMITLMEIARILKRNSKDIIKVKVSATKEEVLILCPDEQTQKSIDIINSATIDVGGIRFELVISNHGKN